MLLNIQQCGIVLHIYDEDSDGDDDDYDDGGDGEKYDYVGGCNAMHGIQPELRSTPLQAHSMDVPPLHSELQSKPSQDNPMNAPSPQAEVPGPSQQYQTRQPRPRNCCCTLI